MFFEKKKQLLPITSGPSIPPGIRPVTHLYLSEVTSDSVLVAWSAPAPPADLFILSYSSADGTDTSKVTLDGSKTRSLVQGLLPSTQYTISLITIQGDVTSEPITASLTTGELLDFMVLCHMNSIVKYIVHSVTFFLIVGLINYYCNTNKRVKSIHFSFFMFCP